VSYLNSLRPEYKSFLVGDIVRERELFTYFDDTQMTGIVIAVYPKFYKYFDDFPETTKVIQDKIKVFWFSPSFVEELSGDMIILVSRVENEKI
tara:strand:+ start:754 stop:1032 length:279 start_codon:yes stop_codon:yes gene_type:complete